MSAPTVNFTIDRLSYGPAGVGRVEGKVVFVPGTVPGDAVTVKLDEEKKTYATGQLVTLRRPSSQRRQPPCPYVTRCGGCPWQQVTYAEQLRAKEAAVREHLRRIGGVSDPPLLPIIPSPQEWHYRHRIRLRAEDNLRLGFSQARSHELVEITSCSIAAEGIVPNLHLARAWLAALRTPVQQVELLTTEPAGGLVLVGDTEAAFHPQDAAVCTEFLKASRGIIGLALCGRGWRKAWGDTTVSFALGVEGMTLTVSQGVFTQVNLEGNRALIAALLRLSDVQKEQRVIELYCGAGNFSLPLARRARELIGIEQNRAAVADAQANAARAGLTNTRFLCAAARAGLRHLLRTRTRGDVVVLDPPRSGAADVMHEVPRLGAEKVVYVSCDPATLARDLRQLHRHGYRIQVLQPLDLFPHSYHVETIALCVLTC
ncbi:MAG TPA: 23S rRNA (uracil(1939)-C(5))-methyltransferase RlmD [Candidatus Binatia bacterium]|jgi:23S rRNA (uracil1939-C5)-methyltransferase|nr:23S rRNA (uracil(1939)-C(5))-methyltransferase RlmD [Candidatus Binatia bacterium]